MTIGSQTTTGVIGYVRVSTEEQAGSGLGLGAQHTAITAECDRRGLQLLAIREDAGLSGKDLRRPALRHALDDLAAGQGSVLMVAKLDRLSRSVADAANLMEAASRQGWSLVALDLGVDTTTPAGEAMANVMVTFGQLERRLIGQRTRDALAQKKRDGGTLGRPRSLPGSVRQRIKHARANGDSFAAIARDLNREGVPTAQGGARWHPATVRKIVLT